LQILSSPQVIITLEFIAPPTQKSKKDRYDPFNDRTEHLIRLSTFQLPFKFNNPGTWRLSLEIPRLGRVWTQDFDVKTSRSDKSRAGDKSPNSPNKRPRTVTSESNQSTPNSDYTSSCDSASSACTAMSEEDSDSQTSFFLGTSPVESPDPEAPDSSSDTFPQDLNDWDLEPLYPNID
jgi:hypothetical protein